MNIAKRYHNQIKYIFKHKHLKKHFLKIISKLGYILSSSGCCVMCCIDLGKKWKNRKLLKWLILQNIFGQELMHYYLINQMNYEIKIHKYVKYFLLF